MCYCDYTDVFKTAVCLLTNTSKKGTLNLILLCCMLRYGNKFSAS